MKKKLLIHLYKIYTNITTNYLLTELDWIISTNYILSNNSKLLFQKNKINKFDSKYTIYVNFNIYCGIGNLKPLYILTATHHHFPFKSLHWMKPKIQKKKHPQKMIKSHVLQKKFNTRYFSFAFDIMIK